MKRGCGRGIAEVEAFFQRPVLVNAEEHAGIEGIARADRACDFPLLDLHRGPLHHFAIAPDGNGAIRMVNARKFADAHVEQLAAGRFGGRPVEMRAIWRPRCR